MNNENQVRNSNIQFGFLTKTVTLYFPRISIPEHLFRSAQSLTSTNAQLGICQTITANHRIIKASLNRASGSQAPIFFEVS